MTALDLGNALKLFCEELDNHEFRARKPGTYEPLTEGFYPELPRQIKCTLEAIVDQSRADRRGERAL
jgi:hypothetical protein